MVMRVDGLILMQMRVSDFSDVLLWLIGSDDRKYDECEGLTVLSSAIC